MQLPVFEKREQWALEAMLFCAQHGRKYGMAGFDSYLWATGVRMAEPIVGYDDQGPAYANANQCVPLDVLVEMCRNGWTFAS